MEKGQRQVLVSPYGKTKLKWYVQVSFVFRKKFGHCGTIKKNLGRFSDIFEIEAIRPLILLENFPDLFRDSLWLHFLDNATALSNLVNGSSSVIQGDILFGSSIVQNTFFVYTHPSPLVSQTRLIMIACLFTSIFVLSQNGYGNGRVVRVVGMVMGTSTVALMPLPFPCPLFPCTNIWISSWSLNG